MTLIDQMSSVKGEAFGSMDTLLHRTITSLLGTSLRNATKVLKYRLRKKDTCSFFFLSSQIRIIAVQKACEDQKGSSHLYMPCSHGIWDD